MTVGTLLRAIDHASPRLVAMRIASGKYRFDEHGDLEKRCADCKDYWPADSEFFFTGTYSDRLSTYCKACYIARRWPNGRPKQVTH